MSNDWSGKGVDDVLSVGDILRSARSGETFEVTKISRHSAVARSVQWGNQVVIPRHQFIEGDFVVGE